MSRRPAGPAFGAQLYYRMLLIRRVEERIQAVYHLREMRSPPHLYMGHEAVAVGVCAALRPSDVVYPYYRSHGWYLAKGGDLDAMVAELHGRETGCSRGWGGSMHLIDLRAGVMGTSAIVGGTIPQAAGAALAFLLRGRDTVTVVSFGDGAIEEGVFHETLNFAALRKLPLVFVGENNLYATNTHIRYRQARPGIHHHGTRFGIPGAEADGNDVLAVHREASKAIARARRGQGPTLLEFHTYRLLEHCGVNEDHELGYRSQAEVRRWQARGPLVRAARLVTRAQAVAMQAEIAARIDAAFARAQAAPWPTALEPTGAAPGP
jgi:TPP-dependent pyruvate/acetoin dehydrogenase alpha subunit